MRFPRRLAILTTVAIAALSIACTDPSGAKRAVEANGLTDVQIGGYSGWGCSNDDTYHTKFTAKNVQGKTVSGVVCGGMLKRNTVRFD